MKRALTLAIVLLLCSVVLAADKPQWDGYWWLNQNQSFKLGWVIGYAKAMDSAFAVHLSTCAATMPLYKDKFPNVDPKEIFQKMCGDNSAFDYDGITFCQFVDGIDTFYRDYRNKELDIGWAIQYVRDEIKGKPAQELDAEVTLWRRCTAAYQSGDTEHIGKACTTDDSAAPKK